MYVVPFPHEKCPFKLYSRGAEWNEREYRATMDETDTERQRPS